MTDHVSSTPISHAAFDKSMRAFAPFEKHPTLAIAVSGGADSMALLLLADHWAKQHNGKVIALTVDHGLRSESPNEAKRIQHWLNQRNIEHHILTWTPPKCTTAVQAQARQARYRLLFDWCRNQGILHLLTAHHLNDQAETLFFRLARGSKLSGLASIAAKASHPHVQLLRPLLRFSKHQLIATLNTTKQEWIEDPSNQSHQYTRNIIRSHLEKQTQTEALTKQAAELALRLGSIRHHMENTLADQLTHCIKLYPSGYGTLAITSFTSIPKEYGLQALGNLLMTLSGRNYPLRTEKLERLYLEIIDNALTPRRTVFGLQLIHHAQTNNLLICREANACQGPIDIKNKEVRLWDQRFEVYYVAKHPLHVSALGQNGLEWLNEHAPMATQILPKPVLPCLPAFWHLETLVYVPHIQYKNATYQEMLGITHFYPAKSLAGTSFFAMNNAA